MTETQAEYAITPTVRLGTMDLAGPGEVISRATEMAKALADIVNDRKLYSNISGKKYVRVEGWSTLGAMLGILPREVEVKELEDGSFEATVELIRASDGAVVGRASALCGIDEKTWGKRPKYARRSMSVTRATGKAYRLGFAWIMQLAGYEGTPAEEMDFTEGEFKEKPKTAKASPGLASAGSPGTQAKPRPKKNGRPLSPEDLKRFLVKKASNYTMDEQTASKAQRGLVAGMLGTTLDGVEVDRHAVTHWLTEGTESVNDLSDGMILAMLDWLDPEKGDDGYVPSPHAIVEARAVLKQAGIDQGQQEMELD